MNKKLLPITLSILFIVSCGGGGGGGGGSTPTTPSTPAPTVNLSADPTSVLLESTSTLTWSSSNATSCSASWTAQTGTSGSETVTITTAGSNSFSISCTGDGGSRSASTTVEGYRNTDGVVVDGYISGAEVFIDEDDDWVLDSNENSTTSDNEGKFTIRYANGNLVSIGGTDLDSQTLLDNLLITHKLAGHSDFKAVTPVTSVAAFMENASLVNAALGIDLSIDVFSFDPVANKGDGGINDYLYEKGNQLTVLAFALQNITNNLNTTTETTQDYFKAITEEIEKEYTETETRVDIETEAFVTKALENVIAAKSVTIDQTAKANVAKALSGMLPIIQVKSSDDLTTGIIRFAVSTLQTDIQAIANGTATAETVSSYTEDLLNYIAEDQSIDSGEIAPDINAITDNVTTSEDTEVEINVLLNDSYVTSSPFSLSATNGTNGSTSVSNNLITYSPDADYNGSDSFSYTLTQGDKTSSADVTVNIEAVNDAPSINIASTIQVEENQTAVTTVSVSDVDEDELTLTLGGTDADSFNLSDENVLTFKEAPDYETKDSYALTLSLTDGIEIVTKDLSIIILDVNYVFSGKVIDGYINGAEIFIDQNFNLTKDDGEFSATSDSDGAFNIDISDESLAACLQKRPIIAEVPVGAIDSSLGEVLSAYQMILPSIEDSIDANAAIFITPFTNLLSDAVIQGINASNIVDEIDVSEGCGDLANSIAINISNELLQISGSIESSLNISFKDLLIDFIQDNSSSTITETSAQRIAAFFPYFKELSDEFDAELSNIHGEIINTNVIIEEDAISSILSSTDIEEMPLSFNAIYETDPNELGWFIQEKIIANGAKVNSDGQIKHHTCFTSSENCITDTRNLDALRNASKRYTRTSTFLNNNYDPENYNYQLVIEDEQRVDFDIDGNPKDRVCIYQNWLYLTPVNTRENFVTNDRYNTGASDGSNNNDDCSDVLANKNEALFVALVDKFDDGIDFEEIDIRITNPIYQNSTFFENKVNNIYQNRNNLDLDPLIQEIASVPRTLKDIENLRAKLTESSTDQISIYWTKRNATGQQLESAKIDIKFDKSKDYFEYGTIENSSTGSEYTVVTSKEGKQAINDIVNILYSNSNVFNSPDYLSYAPIFTSESTFAVDENQIDIGTVTAVDGDDDPITFTISGDDISISTEGVLTFNTAPDFETKTSYTATVTASDGTNPTTQEITVNINNVNDVAPVITSVDSFSVEENQTAIGTATATDADGDNVTFTVSGSELAITSAGVLTFISAPDYETKATYSATVTASDGTNASTQDITVNVTNVNDVAPEFTSEATFSAAENQTAIGTVTATDAEGDDVTFTVSGTELSITSAGVLTFVSAPDYETKTTYTATVTASDGTNSTTQDITVNVTNVNEAPEFTSSANFSAAENQTAIGTVAASDVDGDTITYSISGSDITINSSSGVITFASAPDYETTTSYSATVTASDGTNSTTQDITVNVTNVNDNSPSFTSEATFSADENQTAIGTVAASDADGDTITYSVSGTDSGSVIINSSSGVLTFNSAPNYESKTSYSIVASANDGVNETNQNITITINNINEAPAFTSSTSFSADENQTAIGTVTATDADGDGIVYSISGSDITINSSTGVITFASAPDYETKSAYTETVTATDGTNAATQNITVNITNLPNVSGVAYTSRYSVMDSDIPNTDYLPYASNDTVADAQAIINPSIVTGFIGGSDTLDVYSVSTSSNMYVNLDVVDYIDDSKELRLFIYESDGSVREFSYTSASTEANMTILLPNGDDYLIAVRQQNNSSKYVLTLGQRYTTSAYETSTDFIPDYISNEFIGYTPESTKAIKSKNDISENRIRQIEAEKSELFDLTGEIFDQPGVKKFNMRSIKGLQPNPSNEMNATNRFGSGSYGLEPLTQKQINYLNHWSYLQKLRKLSSETIFDFNYEFETTAFTRDPDYNKQWNLERVQLEPVLNSLGQDVKDIAVAVIDSGGPTPNSTAWNESNLIDGGYDFVYGNSNSIDYLATSSYTGQEISHGTHVSTTIAAKNNGVGINGYAVKALNINVFSVTGTGSEAKTGGASQDNIIQAIRYAAGLSNSSGSVAPTSTPIKVINMSIGGRTPVTYPTAYCAAVQDAIDQGITVVSSAGNQQDALQGLVSYPASCVGAISVGATNSGGDISYYSQQNAAVDISAPGGGRTDLDGDGLYDWILAYGNDSQQSYSQGTSMASPQVAAAIALMYSVDNTLTPARVDNMLANGELTDDRGVAGDDDAFGWGELNLVKAIRNIQEDAGVSASFGYTSTSFLEFGSETTQLTVDLSKVGSSSLSFSNLTSSNATGLTYNQTSVDAEGFGTYTLLIDRSSIPNGEYSTIINFNLSDGSKVAVRVYYNVGALRSRPNIGKAYIGMYNASDDSLWGSLESELDGSLSFIAEDVAPGDYYIATSSDINDNNIYCEYGELCEFYPRLSDTASYFTVSDSNLSGYEIYLIPRYRYGGPNAASLSNIFDTTQNTDNSILLENTSGTGKIVINPIIEVPVTTNPGAKGNNPVLSE